MSHQVGGWVHAGMYVWMCMTACIYMRIMHDCIRLVGDAHRLIDAYMYDCLYYEICVIGACRFLFACVLAWLDGYTAHGQSCPVVGCREVKCASFCQPCLPLPPEDSALFPVIHAHLHSLLLGMVQESQSEMQTAAAAAETAATAPRGTGQGSPCEEESRHIPTALCRCLYRPSGHLRFLQPISAWSLRLTYHSSGHCVHLESGLRVSFAWGPASWASGLRALSHLSPLCHDLCSCLCFLLFSLRLCVSKFLFQWAGSLPFSHGAPIRGSGSQPSLRPFCGAISGPIPYLLVRPELQYLQPHGQPGIQGPHRHLEIHLQPHGPSGLQRSECLEISDPVEDTSCSPFQLKHPLWAPSASSSLDSRRVAPRKGQEVAILPKAVDSQPQVQSNLSFIREPSPCTAYPINERGSCLSWAIYWLWCVCLLLFQRLQ